jgi:hypothetical protein
MSKNIHRLGMPKKKKRHRRPNLPSPVITVTPGPTVVIDLSDAPYVPLSIPKWGIHEVTDKTEASDEDFQLVFASVLTPPVEEEAPKPKPKRRRRTKPKPSPVEEPTAKALNTPAAED